MVEREIQISTDDLSPVARLMRQREVAPLMQSAFAGYADMPAERQKALFDILLKFGPPGDDLLTQVVSTIDVEKLHGIVMELPIFLGARMWTGLSLDSYSGFPGVEPAEQREVIRAKLHGALHANLPAGWNIERTLDLILSDIWCKAREPVNTCLAAVASGAYAGILSQHPVMVRYFHNHFIANATLRDVTEVLRPMIYEQFAHGLASKIGNAAGKGDANQPLLPMMEELFAARAAVSSNFRDRVDTYLASFATVPQDNAEDILDAATIASSIGSKTPTVNNELVAGSTILPPTASDLR